ncbi:MAG TPA: hypothetical protein VG722_03795 [Tepidisphaeraceae bacterium]|nr:hypothetical protein [Tepidisphaeraceae bacterium]
MKLSHIFLLTVPALLVAGCHDSNKSEAAFFTPKQDRAQMQEFSNRQAAAAARVDSSLYPDHFTGANLNSLGKQKLNLILQASNRAATTEIYLTDADSPEHRTAVEQYLASCGWKANQFSLVAGPNPVSHTSARESLDELQSLNGTGTSSSSAGGSMSGASLTSASTGK